MKVCPISLGLFVASAAAYTLLKKKKQSTLHYDKVIATHVKLSLSWAVPVLEKELNVN